MTVTADGIGPSKGPGILEFVLVRALINLVLLFGAYIGLQFAVAAVLHRLPKADHDAGFLVGFAVVAALMFVVYRFLKRLLERLGAPELSFVPALALTGVLAGGFLFCVLYGALWLLGIARWNGFASDAKLLVPLGVALGAGFGEELTFRGGFFRVLEEGFGTAVALGVSAVAFGLVHGLNPGATIVSTAAIALESGVFLGLAYAATRNLWLPIGLHIGWGVTEGGLFGAAVSGHPYHGIFRFSLTGPDILTGGAFGPEASVVAVVISLAASVVLAIIAIRSGRWKPLASRWRLARP